MLFAVRFAAARSYSGQALQSCRIWSKRPHCISRQYKDFTEANDPNGTHDFLKFELSNRSFIFSIVAYDKEPGI